MNPVRANDGVSVVVAGAPSAWTAETALVVGMVAAFLTVVMFRAWSTAGKKKASHRGTETQSKP